MPLLSELVRPAARAVPLFGQEVPWLEEVRERPLERFSLGTFGF